MAKALKKLKKPKMKRNGNVTGNVTVTLQSNYRRCPNPHCGRLEECQDEQDCAAGPQKAAAAPPTINPEAQESGVPPPRQAKRPYADRKRPELRPRPANQIAKHTPEKIEKAIDPELLEPLNAKQELFVKEYLVDLNATQAAIRAGYSPRTATEIGYENLRKPHIALAVDGELLRLGGITRARVVDELGAIAFADIGEMVTWNEEVIDIEPGEKYMINGEEHVAEKGTRTRVVRQRVSIKSTHELTPAQRRTISEVSQSKDGNIKVKLCDKNSALDRLARALGMYVEKEDGSQTTNNVHLTAVTNYYGRPDVARSSYSDPAPEAVGGAGDASD